MSEFDEWMEGAGAEPHDEEALYIQLRMDAALTAHLGGQVVDERIRRSVLAALQMETDVEVRARVIETLRPRRVSRLSPQHAWSRALALAAAIVILLFGIGLWMMRLPAPVRTPLASVHEKRVPEPETRIVQSPATPLDQVTPQERKPAIPVASSDPPRVLEDGPVPRAIETSPKIAMTPATAVPPVPANVATAAPLPVMAAKPVASRPTPVSPPPVKPVAGLPVSGTTRVAARWPFSADSPWNRPIRTDAKFAPVEPAEFAQQRIGYQARTIVVASGEMPLVKFKRERGALLKLRFANEWANLTTILAAPMTIIEDNGEWAIEYRGLRRDGGDWLVKDLARLSLKESGAGREGRGVGDLGLPAMAGVIRAGEWQSGIHHALGISVPAALLNAKASGGKSWVWPAQPLLAPDTSGFAKRGNLHLGTLLALPHDRHPRTLGFPEDSPEHRLALALWQHGVYILGANKMPGDGISLLSEELGAGGANQAAVERLIGLLQVVTNNSAHRADGGAKLRAEPAPPFAATRE